MIDVYAAAGTFVDKNKLAQDLANAVLKWEGVPSTDLFKKNTAAFVHELPSDAISNAAGDNNYVRVQVLTPVNVLNREKQVGVVRELTDIVASAAGDRTLANRTWVLITESRDGGGGSTAKRSPMQTLSAPPVRNWKIRKERRVLEKNPRSSSALRRWHECLAPRALGSGRRLPGVEVTGCTHFLRLDLVEEISQTRGGSASVMSARDLE